VRSGTLGQIDLLASGRRGHRHRAAPLFAAADPVHRFLGPLAGSRGQCPVRHAPRRRKAVAAAAATAQTEDRLIFDGQPSLALPGLRNVEGRQKLAMSDWDLEGRAFADVVEGVRVLTAGGFTGPYALIVSPRLYAKPEPRLRQYGRAGTRADRELARRGVFATGILPELTALLIDSGGQNMDLAVGLDLTVAYVETSNLNHPLPGARKPGPAYPAARRVCSFEPGSTGPANGRAAALDAGPVVVAPASQVLIVGAGPTGLVLRYGYQARGRRTHRR